MKFNYFNHIQFVRVDHALHMIYSGDQTLDFDLRRIVTKDSHDSRELRRLLLSSVSDSITDRMVGQSEVWNTLSPKDKAFVLAFGVMNTNAFEYGVGGDYNFDRVQRLQKGDRWTPEFVANEYVKEFYEGQTTKDAVLHIFNQAFGKYAALCVTVEDKDREWVAQLMVDQTWRNPYSDLSRLITNKSTYGIASIKIDGIIKNAQPIKQLLSNTLLQHGFVFEAVYCQQHYYGDSRGLKPFSSDVDDFDEIFWRFKRDTRYSNESSRVDVRIGNSGMLSTVPEVDRMMRSLSADVIYTAQIKEYIHECRTKYDETYIGASK